MVPVSDTDLEQGRHPFNIRKVSSIEIRWVASFIRCIEEYVEASGEKDIAASEIYAHVENCAGINDCGVWFILNGDDVLGFLVGSILKNQYGKKFAFVDYMYVRKEAHESGVAKEMAETAIAYADGMGVGKITFLTKRNPRAMCRYLPGDWKINSVLIEKCA